MTEKYITVRLTPAPGMELAVFKFATAFAENMDPRCTDVSVSKGEFEPEESKDSKELLKEIFGLGKQFWAAAQQEATAKKAAQPSDR